MGKKRRPSVKTELIHKSREAALNAVQSFNNPLTTFKTETFIVLMVIAWTYLLHAYYRQNGVEYRYFSKGPKRRKFDRTKVGAFKHWELERCLNEKICPLDGIDQTQFTIFNRFAPRDRTSSIFRCRRENFRPIPCMLPKL